MARKAHASRYARAVFEIALERGELDRWQSELPVVVSVVGDPALVAVLESPRLRFDEKARILSEGLVGISPLVLNLVYLLIVRGRLSMIADIAEEYQRLLDAYHGIEPAEVISAVPLDAEEEKKLAGHLSAITGKKVVVKSEVDPGLIGGFVARVGGKLLDGSTRTRLEALKKELAGAA